MFSFTLNRPKSLNAMTPRMGEDLRNVLDWFETDRTCVTGAGRIFCAGADLKAWNNDQQQNKTDEQERVAADPIIAAVPGGAYGGGTEILLNCDIVVAAEGAKFALPEVKRGVVAIQGGIPRLARISGHQLASELLLLGRTIDAAEAQNRFGFVNQVVPPSKVLSAALDIAKQIKLGFHETLLAHVGSPASTRVYKGDNIKEGLKAFNEKRSPAWRNLR
ncbi:putative enoyl-CoA hydratase isomerase family protein [Lyophyllum shimeji]|uniref:Enoyl-CoA hydratase isomerase family protein n=1 Tax=Lyophyllum shimeji TaxID=47721 RepID=A0A9P3UT21_LYOSH|nr:putative enoyl-CoA hydratase isomerase family protein [Lyophyllum shimeji]